ncbi:TPA: Hsp20/alpha crystallin family protein [Legionella pneumophila]|nr:Hsp20/alpha crystallin family protein [Legionella pneumophila]
MLFLALQLNYFFIGTYTMFNLQSNSYPFYRNLGLAPFFGNELPLSSSNPTHPSFPISSHWTSNGVWPLNSGLEVTHITPRADFLEGTESYQFFIDVPGCSSDQLFITLDGFTLTIKGYPLRSNNEDLNGGHPSLHVWFNERSRTGFFRQFILPGITANQSILATLKDGLLHIVIKKDLSKGNGHIEVKNV